MGFPTWTLWGVGFCVVLALLLLVYSVFLQSPSRRLQQNADPVRFDNQVRLLTTSAVALLILGGGFFLAGVPLGNQSSDGSAQQPTAFPDSSSQSGGIAIGGLTPAVPTPDPASGGAFSESANMGSGDIDSAESSFSDSDTSGLSGAATPAIVQPQVADSTATLVETNTPTPTATPTITPTPRPTYTATPIDQPTARVETGGRTLWVRTIPGAPQGQNNALVYWNDMLIIRSGQAFVEGRVWQEVETVDGIQGWVPKEFLDFGEASE